MARSPVHGKEAAGTITPFRRADEIDRLPLSLSAIVTSAAIQCRHAVSRLTPKRAK